MRLPRGCGSGRTRRRNSFNRGITCPLLVWSVRLPFQKLVEGISTRLMPATWTGRQGRHSSTGNSIYSNTRETSPWAAVMVTQANSLLSVV